MLARSMGGSTPPASIMKTTSPYLLWTLFGAWMLYGEAGRDITSNHNLIRSDCPRMGSLEVRPPPGGT